MVVDSRGTPKPKGAANPETFTAPSAQPPPQHPAHKPGEPIPYGERPEEPPPDLGEGGEETLAGRKAPLPPPPKQSPPPASKK